MFGATVRLGRGIKLSQLSNMHAKHRRSTLKSASSFAPPPAVVAEGEGGVTKSKKSAPPSSFPSKNEAVSALVDESTRETLAAVSPAMDLDVEQEKPLQRPQALISVKKTPSKLKIKKSLDRKTFLAVCRAVAFGVTLIGLGVVMAVLGFYRDYFAQEPGPSTFDSATNRTVASTVVNPSTKAQVESLSYIGPCIMGCGMFILMMACVMTLEGRDRNTHLFTQRIINRRRQIMRQNQEMEEKERTQSKIHLTNNERVDRVARKRPEESVDANSNKGNLNRAFKDDHTLKSCAPVTTNAIHLADVRSTLSRNGGVDSRSLKIAAAETMVDTPATAQLSSASTGGAPAADHQLLQRFLDEQSQMDDYRRIILKQSQNVSNAAPLQRVWSPPNDRRRRDGSGPGVVVAAQIHDYRGRPSAAPVRRAPLAAPETVSTCSGAAGSGGAQSAPGGAADRDNSPPSPFCLVSPSLQAPNSDDSRRRNSSQNSAASYVTVQSQIISSSANNNHHKNQFSNNKMENSTILPRPGSPDALTM